MSKDIMPDQNNGSDENENIYVEIDGAKFKADPEDPTKALMGEDEKPIPFEKKKEETEDEQKEREKKEKEQKEEDDKDPPIRKSAKDHIIDRKNRKIEKLKKEKRGDGKDTDDDEFTKEGEELIDKKIGKAIKPVLNQIRTQTDEQELSDLYTKKDSDGDLMYPDARKIEKKIRKYMKAYPTASIEFIYLGLIAKQMRLTAKRTKADKKADKKKVGGHSRREGEKPDIPDVRGMSDKKLGELIHKVKTRQFG